MTHDDDLSELLAAYALDALDDDERAAVDEELARSPRARAELARYESVAGLLGEATTADDLPDGSWERLAARLDASDRPAVDPPPPDAREVVRAIDDAPSRRADAPSRRADRTAGRGRRVLGGVAAAAAVAAGVLGGVVVHQQGELDDARAQASPARAAAAALARPGARSATLVSADGGVSVRTVVDDRNTAYLFADALPELPAGRTYQLWSVDSARPVSLGLLGTRPTVVTVPASALVRTLAITVEDAAGATAPTSAPVVAGTLA